MTVAKFAVIHYKEWNNFLEGKKEVIDVKGASVYICNVSEVT